MSNLDTIEHGKYVYHRALPPNPNDIITFPTPAQPNVSPPPPSPIQLPDLVFAATKLALHAIQASTDAFPPLKSVVSAVIVILELSERAKSNKKGCERIAHRSAQLVQDIWRQTKDFDVALPVEVERSVAEIETLFNEIEKFFNEFEKEKPWQRFARQDRDKSQVEEYGRLLDEAMLHFSINLELSIHRLHLESAAADQKRHTAVMDISRMSESERLQLLTQIRDRVLSESDVGGQPYGEISVSEKLDSRDFFFALNQFLIEG
ncbi:hypothetical protein B0H19DRAFT_1265656 [Mycena capillaripes]|nr:hypothetical protein B0H19DRAFT_1265656 [Mycena capillaripes]